MSLLGKQEQRALDKSKRASDDFEQHAAELRAMLDESQRWLANSFDDLERPPQPRNSSPPYKQEVQRNSSPSYQQVAEQNASPFYKQEVDDENELEESIVRAFEKLKEVQELQKKRDSLPTLGSTAVATLHSPLALDNDRSIDCLEGDDLTNLNETLAAAKETFLQAFEEAVSARSRSAAGSRPASSAVSPPSTPTLRNSQPEDEERRRWIQQQQERRMRDEAEKAQVIQVMLESPKIEQKNGLEEAVLAKSKAEEEALAKKKLEAEALAKRKSGEEALAKWKVEEEAFSKKKLQAEHLARSGPAAAPAQQQQAYAEVPRALSHSAETQQQQPQQQQQGEAVAKRTAEEEALAKKNLGAENIARAGTAAPAQQQQADARVPHALSHPEEAHQQQQHHIAKKVMEQIEKGVVAQIDLEKKEEERIAAEKAAPIAAEKAAASAWDEAVPFTLTLDVDLNSIGDKEAFKRDVIKDVATAANIDARHVKVKALRAGSVMVDMLIAKEAGDAQNIVRDLEEQLKSPNSLLMQGKVTRKTKKGPPCAAEADVPPPPGTCTPQISQTSILQHENAQLRSSWEKAQAARSDLMQQIAQQQEEMADLKAALQSAAPSKENGSFPNWNNSEQTALVISTLTAEIQTLQSSLGEKSEQLLFTNKALQSLETSCIEKQKMLDKVTAELIHLKVTYIEKDTQNRELKGLLLEFEENAEQTRINEDRSGAILSLKTQLLSTEQACALERSAHAQTKADLMSKDRESILQQEKLNKANESLAHRIEEIAACKKELAALGQQLSEAQALAGKSEELAQLKNEVESYLILEVQLKNEVAALKAELNDVKGRHIIDCDELQSQLRLKQEEAQSAQRLTNLVQEEAQQLASKLNKALSDIEESHDAVSCKQKMENELLAKNAELLGALSRMQQELNKQEHEFNDRIAQLQGALGREKLHQQVSREHIDEQDLMRKQLFEEEKRLREEFELQLANAQEENQRFQMKNHLLQDHVHNKTQEAAALQEEVRLAHCQIAALEEELYSFRQRHFEARAMVEQEESDALNERSSSTLARHAPSNPISSLARPALSNSRCASLLEALEDPKGYIFPEQSFLPGHLGSLPPSSRANSDDCFDI